MLQKVKSSLGQSPAPHRPNSVVTRTEYRVGHDGIIRVVAVARYLTDRGCNFGRRCGGGSTFLAVSVDVVRGHDYAVWNCIRDLLGAGLDKPLDQCRRLLGLGSNILWLVGLTRGHRVTGRRICYWKAPEIKAEVIVGRPKPAARGSLQGVRTRRSGGALKTDW